MGGVNSGRRSEDEAVMRPVEYRVPDRLREPTAFEIFEGGERLLKRVLNDMSMSGNSDTGLARDIRNYLSLAEKGRPAIEHARKVVDRDTQEQRKEAEHVRKERAPHRRKVG
jgi:hypothetical protein